jgi:glutaredoxin
VLWRLGGGAALCDSLVLGVLHALRRGPSARLRTVEGEMEQRCHLSMVWLTWIGLPLLAGLVAVRAGWVLAGVVLVVGVVGQVLYIRWFPHLSRWLGYGSVVDVPAGPGAKVEPIPVVTIYTANVCPFCPIVKSRLTELQRRWGFDLRVVDVTFRPEIIRDKGLRSVPVVEANGRLLVGNATSEQLVAFLTDAALSRGTPS